MWNKPLCWSISQMNLRMVPGQKLGPPSQTEASWLDSPIPTTVSEPAPYSLTLNKSRYVLIIIYNMVATNPHIQVIKQTKSIQNDHHLSPHTPRKSNMSSSHKEMCNLFAIWIQLLNHFNWEWKHMHIVVKLKNLRSN